MSTLHNQFFNGIPCTVPNSIAGEGRGFYISYNNYDIGIYGSDTTALVLGQMEKFYILNGDHRKAYANLVPRGFNACLDYFKGHLDQISKYSDKV
jgi:hypothetical protein